MRTHAKGKIVEKVNPKKILHPTPVGEKSPSNPNQTSLYGPKIRWLMVLSIGLHSRGRNSVIGTIHGRPRPPIFGGPGTEHLSEYSGVLLQLTHLLISAHRQSHSVAVMMPGLRTIPDTKYINYMTVLNLFYAYYTENNLTCGAPYRTFNTYDTNKTAAPFHHPVLKRIIPSQI